MKKRKAVSWNQTDFTSSLAAPSLPSVSAPADAPAPIPAADLETFDLDELDDYIEEPHRAAYVDPPVSSPRVIVEMVGDVYEVSRLRDNGTSSCCVIWNRSELEELLGRIKTALEIS